MARVFSAVFVTILFQGAWGSVLPVNECSDTVGIIGGKNSTIQDVPSAVSLGFGNQNSTYYHVCGGSIINDLFILTAAMCVDGQNLTSATVRVGSTYLTSGGEFAEVEKAIVHKGWNSQNAFIVDNIALLKLKKPILFGWLAKANLPSENYNVTVGSEATFSGWGGSNSNETYTEVFHQTTIPIKAQKCCKNPNGSALNDTKKICAGSSGHDACLGDGGSPLTQDGFLIGINSYGSDETCGKLPGIYTNVASYVSWINDNIKENP